MSRVLKYHCETLIYILKINIANFGSVLCVGGGGRLKANDRYWNDIKSPAFVLRLSSCRHPSPPGPDNPVVPAQPEGDSVTSLPECSSINSLLFRSTNIVQCFIEHKKTNKEVIIRLSLLLKSSPVS